MIKTYMLICSVYLKEIGHFLDASVVYTDGKVLKCLLFLYRFRMKTDRRWLVILEDPRSLYYDG